MYDFAKWFPVISLWNLSLPVGPYDCHFIVIFFLSRLAKKLQEIGAKCRACPCPLLSVIALIPVGFAVSLMVYVDSIFMKIDLSALFNDNTFYLRSPTSSETFAAVCITFMSVSAVLIFVLLIFECCLCCNVTFVRGQRANEQSRDKCRFLFFAITILLTYISIACLHLVVYFDMKNYKIPESEAIMGLKNGIQMKNKNWDKVQVLYECCGVHNYTDWKLIFHESIPESCCHELKESCSKNVSDIYHRGCLKKCNYVCK